MVPVVTEQVGWVMVTVGAAGAPGAALITPTVAIDTHPELFFTVTL